MINWETLKLHRQASAAHRVLKIEKKVQQLVIDSSHLNFGFWYVSANFMISWFLNLSNSFYQTYDLFISATSPNWISPLFLDHCTSAEYLFNVICAFIPASLSIQDHHTTTTSNKWRGVKVQRVFPPDEFGAAYIVHLYVRTMYSARTFIMTKILKKSRYALLHYVVPYQKSNQ